jgi:hypothetical protein
MTDTVTIKELVHSPPNDMLSWAVMHLISRNSDEDFLKRFNIDASNHDNTVTVEMRVNGVKVPVKEVFKELQRQLDAMVKREAMELIATKCGSANAAIQLLDRIGDLVRREAADALGVDWEDR